MNFLKTLTLGCIAFALTFTSCSKKETPDPIIQSSDKQITSFVFLLTNNPIDVNVVGIIDEVAKTISVEMPTGTIATGLLPEIKISTGATVSPNAAIDFTNPVEYTVTAEDGSKAIYIITVIAPLSQRQILQAILDANPGNTINWDLQNTTDLGTLDSVTTNGQGLIIGLHLRERKLTQLPPEIGLLSELKTLIVHKNQLTSIPPEIGQLTNLELLSFVSNQLASLPVEIGQLTKLKNLGLTDNLFKSMPLAIAKLINLEQFNFAINLLTSLPQEIGQLTNLELLSLFSNQLTSLPTAIGQLRKLKVLSLQKNQIISLPGEIGQMTALIQLTIHENQLTRLPNEIGLLTSLGFLNLGDNQLTSIPPEIGLLTNLGFLNLEENQLTSIPPEIGFLTELDRLYIRNNKLSIIPLSIGLMVLYSDPLISFLKDDGANINITSQKDALISIYTSNPGNTLKWSVDNYPEVEFNDNGNPRSITMNNKNLTRIPWEIDRLTELEGFNANGNPLGSIPSSFGNISSLVVLTLDNTNITTVPSSLGNLKKFALLAITGNPITSIPKSVCDLQISNGGILTIVTDPGEGCK